MIICISGMQQPNPHFPMPPHMQAGHPLFPFPMMMSPGGQQVSQPSPPMSQASELRAALAKPSKLIKQEQLLQRIQQPPPSSQPQPVSNHPQPGGSQDSRQSPNIPSLGQHRMPFTFQEPRSSVSRAEPKNPQGQFEGRPTQALGPKYNSDVHLAQPGSSAFSQPDLCMPIHGDIRPGLTHPDAHPGIPQQMFAPGLQHGLPFPPGSMPMGLPPRMVLGSDQHPFMSQMSPHLPAMVPPQVLLATQPGGAPGDRTPISRPPSRRTSSPSLSPRVATPHQAPTPNPQSAAQPVSHPGTPNLLPGAMAAVPTGLDQKMDSMLAMLQVITNLLKITNL